MRLRLRCKDLVPPAAAAASLLAGTLFACCAGFSSFEEQVGRSKLIFVGTLTSAEPARTPNAIVTRYRFDDVRYAKGHGPADSLVLIQDGGCFGGFCVTSCIQVSFAVGTRYVVFADSGYWSRPKDYSPAACSAGPFPIRADSGFQDPIVFAAGESPIIAFDEGHMVLLSRRPWNPGMGVRQLGTDGRTIAPEPPPPLPLDELIRRSDLEWEARLREYSTDPRRVEQAEKRMRFVSVFPHQDPGVRVTEEEFMRVLGEVVARVGGP